MKVPLTLTSLVALSLVLSAGCNSRKVRMAEDITPGNPIEKELDWSYGANDIRIQTKKLTAEVMDKWYDDTRYDDYYGKPRLIITQVDNRTDTYVPTDMVREIFESVAAEDGRFRVIVGDSSDRHEMDLLMRRVQNDPKYQNSSRLKAGKGIAPQFLAKIRLNKATTTQKNYSIEDYRMTINLYDMETQELIDSAWDVLRKKVWR